MPIKDLNASPNGTLVLQHENIPLHRWKLTVKQDDKRIFLYMLYHWMELGENILNNSFEDHLRKWWQTALKNTYLMDKLKFHKNICNLNRLISNNAKIFVLGNAKIRILCYMIGILCYGQWNYSTHMYICLKF